MGTPGGVFIGGNFEVHGQFGARSGELEIGTNFGPLAAPWRSNLALWEPPYAPSPAQPASPAQRRGPFGSWSETTNANRPNLICPWTHQPPSLLGKFRGPRPVPCIFLSFFRRGPLQVRISVEMSFANALHVRRAFVASSWRDSRLAERVGGYTGTALLSRGPFQFRPGLVRGAYAEGFSQSQNERTANREPRWSRGV